MLVRSWAGMFQLIPRNPSEWAAMKPVWMCSALLLACAAGAASANEHWSLTHEIELVSKEPRFRGPLVDKKITADLYRPKVDGKVPAAVIINSSGGISAHTEHYYARILAEHGVAALVVDSFAPRGVRETS